MHGTGMFAGEGAKEPEIEGVVPVAKEASLAIVATLPYMQRDAGNDEAGGPGHES
jgi:hypothetical protein